MKAASALESLAASNPEAQKEIDAADAQRPLIRLLKMWLIEVKEQGTCIIMFKVFCVITVKLACTGLDINAHPFSTGG